MLFACQTYQNGRKEDGFGVIQRTQEAAGDFAETMTSTQRTTLEQKGLLMTFRRHDLSL